MREITWRKDGDDYYGEEAGTHTFDPVTWLVRHGHVFFRVPANPAYFTPTWRSGTDEAVLASLEHHKAAVAELASNMAEP